MASLPVVTGQLVRRIARLEAECTVARMERLREVHRAGDDVAIRRHGDATAVAMRHLPTNSLFNRVMGAGPEHAGRLGELLAVYAELGTQAHLEALPGWFGEALATEALGLGLRPFDWTAMLYRLPSREVLPPADGVTVRPVGADEGEVFADLLLRGFGVLEPPTPDDLRGVASYLGIDWWHCYLAEYEGRPAGIGVLALGEGLGYLAAGCTIPELRGHGVQTALIGHRVRVAAELGCGLVTVRARFDGTSQHNLERCGFRVAGTLQEWRGPAPSEETP